MGDLPCRRGAQGYAAEGVAASVYAEVENGFVVAGFLYSTPSVRGRCAGLLSRVLRSIEAELPGDAAATETSGGTAQCGSATHFRVSLPAISDRRFHWDAAS